jgi:hypothetical protein
MKSEARKDFQIRFLKLLSLRNTLATPIKRHLAKNILEETHSRNEYTDETSLTASK